MFQLTVVHQIRPVLASKTQLIRQWPRFVIAKVRFEGAFRTPSIRPRPSTAGAAPALRPRSVERLEHSPIIRIDLTPDRTPFGCQHVTFVSVSIKSRPALMLSSVVAVEGRPHAGRQISATAFELVKSVISSDKGWSFVMKIQLKYNLSCWSKAVVPKLIFLVDHFQNFTGFGGPPAATFLPHS
ncbi:hypothetical protein EVAR_25444_1 [Eumeta japonica]|uniref:Uncharacterized protein n=1 Tax=Eumeta variegata TaxID=151549 RepID=A0A4C1VLZ7_EUMVA|nr:hypothetical protein EVAR_25444_1 [Eumeta japonica]